MLATSQTAAGLEHNPNRFKLGQRSSLDGLRGVATLIVTLSHFGLVRGSVVGLELLFALSGFLITVLLVEEWERRGAISVPAFYLRRARRIVPPLFAMMAVVSVVTVALGMRTPGEMLGDCAASGLFLTDGFAVAGFLAPRTMWGQTWSLSVEMQFYLVWPLVFLLLRRRGGGPKRLTSFLVAAIVVEATARLVLFINRPSDPALRIHYLSRLYFPPEMHADSLLFGCLAGASLAWNRLPTTARFESRLRAAGWCSLAFLAYSVCGVHPLLPAYFCGLETLLGASASVVLVWLMRRPPAVLRGALESGLLSGIGRVSYGLFLFHIPIIHWLEPKTPAAIMFGFALSFACAFLSYFAVERHFQKRRPPIAAVAPAVVSRRAA